MNPDNKNQTLSKAADTGKSVHLSASAGSGKTRALKDRYLALLDVLDNRGLNIDQAVAITFTDKAAAEIKERVMRDLPEAMLKKIIRGRQDLRISTIHSFCMNLLKRYPLEAGLPPDFGVLDTRDQAYKIQKAVEDALEESDQDPEIMAPLRDFTADDLTETIMYLLSIRSRIKRMEIDANGPEKLSQSLRAGIGTGQAEAEMKALIKGPEWHALFTQMELLLRSQGNFYDECNGTAHGSLAAAQDLREVSRTTEALKPVYFTQKDEPRKKLPISRTAFKVTQAFRYPAYETLYASVQDVLSRFLSAYRRAQAGYEAISLLRLFQRAEAMYQDSKLREGLLDFDDLEIYAYRLLRSAESADILYWLDRKILHFLVDEFQDTSDIQWAILDKLTEELFAGQGADKPMGPTLFVVGDEKQSIYRFREANYRLIENVRGKMEKNIPPGSREIMTLEKNFRSTPEVVSAVNQIFATLWGKDYQASEADRRNHRGSVRLIELVPGPSEEASAGPTEAEVLAREIRSLIKNRTTIYERPPASPSHGSDGNGWTEREAGYGDCAVLIQTRGKLKEYEAALQAENIPFRVVGGIGFYEEDEIQAIINVLFFLWNRDDKLSLAAALKSPLFGLMDRDIFELMQDDGTMLGALKRRRPDDWKFLNEWMNSAGLVPLPHLVHRIIQDRGAYVRFGRRNPQAVFNIDKLLDTAREFDRRGYTTLQDFVEWVKNIRESEQREATADMNLPGFQGAVSILTVHKAKGLEYPVVFLPGMNQAARSLSIGPDALIEEADGGRRMAIKGAGNPLYDELWEREKEELRREHQRLLYVAMTRARDRLIMIGTLNSSKAPVKQNTWLDYLHRTVPMQQTTEEKPGPRIVQYAWPDWQARVAPVGPAAPGEQLRKETTGEYGINAGAVLDALSPLPRSESAEWKRATDFIEKDREKSIEARFLQGAGRVSPLLRGSVLHRCLEEATKSGGYDLSRIMSEYPDVQALPKEARQQFADDVQKVMQSLLEKKEFAWIFEQRAGSYSELPFLYQKGRSLISGIIDRVVVKDGKGFVIDYKAILLENDEDLTSWTTHYKPQIEVYCEAVKEIFKLGSVEGYLLFLDSNKLELTTKA